MRPAFLFLFLAGCADNSPPAAPPESACHRELFEGSSFILCDPGTGAVEIHSGHRSFSSLQSSLGSRSADVAFAMNAGMFDDAGKPVGLMVEDGRQLHAINRRTRGFGNFHLMPNGVFLVRKDGRAEVMTGDRYKPSSTIAFATQSGPMLLIDGKMHPRFDQDGQSRYIRNGVGIDPNGRPLFVISLGAVSFGKLARFLRDRHRVRNALFLDGSVSSLWDPASNRMDAFTELGPIVVAFTPAESERRRASRARP
jgi:prepilin-type processing-associated H-X9-DG protein